MSQLSSNLMPSASPAWERAVGLVGGVLLIALAVLLVAEDTSAPSVAATVQDVAAGPGGTHVVTAEVRNDGGETVEDVQVVAEVQAPDGTVLGSGEAVVGFLPGGGAEVVGLVVPVDPAGHRLVVRPLGWSDA